jgi:hypothetical protein
VGRVRSTPARYSLTAFGGVALPRDGWLGHQLSRPTMTDDTTLTARKRLRIHIREGRRSSDSPIVEAQLEAALDAWNDLPPTPLQECPVCGKVGLPERILQHQCN